MVLIPIWMVGSLVTCLFVAASARLRDRGRAAFDVPLYVPRDWVAEHESRSARGRAEA
jgi:hypothetical protein